MLQVLEDMEEEMRSTFKSELEIFYRMSAVMIQMIMYDAEKQNSTVRADVGFMENYKALQEMKNFEQLEMQSDFSLTKKPIMKATLPTLGAPVKVEKVMVEDEGLKNKNAMLEGLVSELQKKLVLIAD
jgi:hypothetical protein